MGTFNNNILPTSTGLNLGSPGQRWDVFANILDLDGPIIGTFNPSNLNSILFVDGVTYSKISTAYAALPSAGGLVVVPANYAETLNSDLRLDKNDSGVLFAGSATLTMGTSRIIVPVGTKNVSIDGMAQTSSDQSAVRLNYTGTGDCILVGDSSADTRGIRIANIGVVSQTAGANSVTLNRVQYIKLDSLTIDGNTSGKGIILDGTGNFCGDGLIQNVRVGGCGSGIYLTGSGNQAANANTIINPTILGGTVIGINFQASSQHNVVLGGDIEGTTTAVNFGATCTGNYVMVRTETVTNDALFAAGTSYNWFQPLQAITSTTDLGTNNTVMSTQKISFGADGSIKMGGASPVITGAQALQLQAANQVGWDLLYTRAKLVGGATAVLGFSGDLGATAPDIALSRLASGHLALGNGTAADVTGILDCGGVKIGAGTTLTKAVVYTPTLSPASVGANTTAEEIYSVAGLTSGDTVYVNKPTAQAGLGIVGFRVSSADHLAITWANVTALPIVPTASEVYRVVAVRS